MTQYGRRRRVAARRPTAFPGVGTRGHFGAALQAEPLAQQHAPDLGPQGFTQNGPGGPTPCTPYALMFAGLQTAADGSVVAIDELAVPMKAAKTVTVHYKGIQEHRFKITRGLT